MNLCLACVAAFVGGILQVVNALRWAYLGPAGLSRGLIIAQGTLPHVYVGRGAMSHPRSVLGSIAELTLLSSAHTQASASPSSSPSSSSTSTAGRRVGNPGAQWMTW